MKKFLILFPVALLVLLIVVGVYRYDNNRIKKTKGGISISKIASNLSYYYEDENDMKTIISVINNAEKSKMTYKEVEKTYKGKEQYDIDLQHINGAKSIYHLWLDEDKPVITEQYNGTLLINSEDMLKLKEILGKLKKHLSIDTITLENIEKLFKDEGIMLANKGNEQAAFDTLQQKHSTVYLINNDKEKILNVYVFSSEEERKKARVEYDDKTAIASMVYHEIYESKNIMVILTAGDKTNAYYTKVSAAIEKIKTQ